MGDNMACRIRRLLRKHPVLSFGEIRRRTKCDSSGLSARLCGMLGRGVLRRSEDRRWYAASGDEAANRRKR